MNARAETIKAWLFKNRGNIDKDTYNSFSKTLADIRSGGTSVVDAFKKASDYYSQWQSEDEYNKWYEDYQAKQDMATSKMGVTGWETYLADRDASEKAAQDKIDNESWTDKIGRWLGSGGPVDTTLPMGTTTAVISANRDGVGADLDRMPNDKWSDEQRNIFGYLYMTNKGKAFDYAKETNQYLDMVAEEEVLQKISESATSGFWAGTGHTIGAILTAPLGMADFLGNLVEGNTTGTISRYDGQVSPFEYSQAVTGGITAHLNNKGGVLDDSIPIIGGKGWGDIYGVGTSIAQSMASAYTLGSAGTHISYFGQGAASGVDDALSRGATEGQAVLYGTSLGVFEGLAEMIGVDNLFKLGSTSTVKGFIKNILNQAGAEGAEEGLTALFSNIADNVIMQDKSNFNFLVAQYMAQGMSESEAKWKAWMKSAGDIAFDTIAGAVSGGVSGGIHTIAQSIAENRSIKNHGQDIIDNGSADYLKELALEMSGLDKKTAKLAKNVGANPSAKNVGKLSAQMENAITKQNITDIQRALVEKGLSEKDAKRVAEYLGNVEELTDKQRAEIESNESIKAVVKELLDNPKSKISERGRNLLAARLGVDINNSKVKATKSGKISLRNDVDVTNKVSESGKTTIVGTGETVAIDKKNPIAKIKYIDNHRIVYLNTDHGLVEASKIKYSSKEEGLLYESFVDMNPAFANAVIKNYDGSVPIQTYVNGMREGIILYGMHNFQAVGKDVSKNSFFAELSEEDQAFALKLGRAYAKADAKKADKELHSAIKNATEKAKASEGAPTPKEKNVAKRGQVSFEKGAKPGKQHKKIIALAKHLARAMNINIVFYDATTTTNIHGQKANGYYDEKSDTIYLDLQKSKSDAKTIAFTLSHELVHFIKKWSPKKYAAFAEFLMDQYAEHGISSANLLKQKMSDLNTTDVDFAYEEMIADACETMLLDSNATVKLMELHKNDLELFDKIKLHILKILNDIREAYKNLGYQPTSDEAKALLGMTDVLEQFYSLFEDAAVDATQSYQASSANNSKTTSDSNIKKQEKRIRAGMSEAERYSVLKDAKIIAIADLKSEAQPLYSEIEKIPEKAKGQVETLIKDLADDLEILNVPLSTAALNIEFQLSKNNGLRESLSQQLKYGGNFHDFSKALVNLRDILARAILIETHTEDRYKGTEREDINFEAGYVLFSAFKSQEYVIPVKLEIKQKKDVHNILYVVVSMTKIKRTSVMESALDDTEVPIIPLSDTDSIYSLSHLVSKVNPVDRHFLKYLPDQMLNAEQQAAKSLALKEDKAKLNVLSKRSDGVKKQLKKSSNRETLSSILESAIDTTTQEGRNELKKLKEYREIIAKVEELEEHLASLNTEIKEISFTKGSDRSKLRELNDEKIKTVNRINVYDKKLLRLESMKHIRAVLEREKSAAYKKAEQRGKDALDAYRDKMVKTQEQIISHYQDSYKRGVEGRHKTEMRHKIQKVVNELNRLLLNPTKDKHVPIGLQKSVAAALDVVNMDTVGADERIAKYDALIEKTSDPEVVAELVKTRDRIASQGENLFDKLNALKLAYSDIKDSEDPLVRESHNEVIEELIETTAELVGETSIREMSMSQLEAVYDMYRAVLATVRNSNKLFKEGRQETITEYSENVKSEVKEAGGHRDRVLKVTKGLKKFSWYMLKPIYAIRMIGSDALTELYENVRKGEDAWARDVSEAKEFFEKTAEKYSYASWDLKKQYSFKDIGDHSFSLSLEQIMSLYAYSKRDQADRHLEVGGFIFGDDIEVVEKKHGIPMKYEVNDANPYRLDSLALANVISILESDFAQVKGFVDEMQAYLSNVMGAKGNEVSLAMYDIKLYKERNYFPLKSSKYYREFDPEKNGTPKIKNSGFSKKTVPQAGNPIVLSNFMDVWANHVNDMSMYHAFVLPLEDFMRVYNYSSTVGGYDSVQQYIKNAYGEQANQYIETLMNDLNGGARVDSTAGFMNKLIGPFKKSAVFASASVVIQQPSAIARAFALVDIKYFGGKPQKRKHKEIWSEVKKYAPVAIIKEMGYFDTGMGKNTVKWIKGNKNLMDKFDDVASKAPSLADEYAWCAIWNAIKRETLHTHTELRPNSEEFLNAVGERFTEVITKTQVYDSVLSRSAMMRSKDTGMKMVTAFMAEPTTSLNMLVDAIVEGKRGNTKQKTRYIGSVVASMILNSILVSLVYAGRDDDEKKTYVEKYIGTLTEELLDSLNPLTLIPFVKDIVSISQGYDVKRSDMAAITDLISAWDNLDNDNRSAYRKVEDFAGAIASIFGLPVKNVMRDARGIYNTVNSFINGEKTTGAGIKSAVVEAVSGNDKSNGQQLYEAMMSGDSSQIERVKGRFKDQNAINSAIRKALRDNDPRIKEAAVARYIGDISEYMRIAKEIVAEGYFKQDDIVAAINSEINSLKKGEGTTETSAPTDKATSLYKVDDYYSALVGGDQATAYVVKENIINTDVENGKDRDEAEADFNSKFASHLRERYEKGDISDYEAMNMLIDYAGKSEEEASSKIQYWNFKMEYPDYDLSEEAVTKYYNDVEPSGITIYVYYDYSKQRAKCKGVDLNGDGKTDSGSVKSEVLKVIDSLPITYAQKDVLYYLNGWSAKTIWEAPWH